MPVWPQRFAYRNFIIIVTVCVWKPLAAATPIFHFFFITSWKKALFSIKVASLSSDHCTLYSIDTGQLQFALSVPTLAWTYWYLIKLCGWVTIGLFPPKLICVWSEPVVHAGSWQHDHFLFVVKILLLDKFYAHVQMAGILQSFYSERLPLWLLLLFTGWICCGRSQRSSNVLRHFCSDCCGILLDVCVTFYSVPEMTAS